MPGNSPSPFEWLREKLTELGRNLVDALTTIIVIIVLIAVCVALFFWFLMPWHQRKVREAEAAAVSKANADRAAKEAADRLAAERAALEAQATYRETAVKADAQRKLNGDPVDVANGIIKGRR